MRALAAGYRLSDLRFALRTWRAEQLAEIDRTTARGEKLWVRITSRIPILSAVVSLSAATAIAILTPQQGLVTAVLLVGQLATFAGVASAAMLSTLGKPMIPTSLYRRAIGVARGWLWNSRVGNWLAERLAPKRGGVPLAAFRPTEMALEVAIDDLFAALPDPYRESLRDLPAIARRLTARATELRETIATVTTAGGASIDADPALSKAKGATALRLTETVTALERLRIGLLRLHAGVADLQPVTTALEAARAIDLDVKRLVDGQAEVSGVRRALSFERRSPSPA
jgi:hypothetical protein